MGYRSIIIILAVLEALMSAYLMKQGMPATAGRKQTDLYMPEVWELWFYLWQVKSIRLECI